MKVWRLLLNGAWPDSDSPSAFTQMENSRHKNFLVKCVSQDQLLQKPRCTSSLKITTLLQSGSNPLFFFPHWSCWCYTRFCYHCILWRCCISTLSFVKNISFMGWGGIKKSKQRNISDIWPLILWLIIYCNHSWVVLTIYIYLITFTWVSFWKKCNFRRIFTTLYFSLLLE